MFQIKTNKTVKEFGGHYSLYSHWSEVCQCLMQFSLYLPEQAQTTPVPLVYWLSGLTCTDENFRTKSGVAKYASEQGVALVIPDTSPRGDEVPNDERYHLGQGAGFYVNATESPWSKHYQMYDYIAVELPQVVQSLNLPIAKKCSIMGHSMGGHGALTIALKNPEKYACVSALAPICNPTESLWGALAYETYLGKDKDTWRAYDSCYLLASTKVELPLLVDQGDKDEFYPDQLRTQSLIDVCRNLDTTIRIQVGYDHSFHFIATFIGEHLRWHASHLHS